MKIKYQEKGYAIMSGSALLRQLQNEHTPALDLLVRESVQNSLDAALSSSESVRIDILTGTFETKDLCSFFEGIEQNLMEKYPGKNQFLAVKDLGTSGLTGPLSLSQVQNQDYGNLQKLIYQIAKPQEKERAGGSWGLGKTVYFRIGIGLVIYYSRIFNKDSGKYEERLAATLVEDEEKENLLTQNPHSTGIAWWGKEDPDHLQGTIPLVDNPEIAEILKVFGIPPMKGQETGTVIILPYINEERLLDQTLTERERTREAPVPSWKRDLPMYLGTALQKWYCPRLDNPKFGVPFLSSGVNGREIRKEDFLPFFRLIQTLYNHRPEDPERFEGREIESEDIKLVQIFDISRNSSGSTAGTLSFLKVSKRELGMEPPENYPSPYTDIDTDRTEEEGAHEPILAYLRSPGMIVSYETGSQWTKTMPKTDSEEFIVAVFRPKGEAVLSEKLRTEKIQNLEDYLRKTENADHMSWEDVNLKNGKPAIVRKIRDNIKNKISNRYREQNHEEKKIRNLGLGRKLGELLLPEEGKTYWDARTGGSSGPGGSGGSGTGDSSFPPSGRGSRSSRFGMEPNGPARYYEDEVRIPVILSLGEERQGELSIFLRTEAEKMNAAKWYRGMSSPFPARITGLKILNITSGKTKKTGKKKRKSDKKDLFGKSGFLIDHSCEYEDVYFEFICPEKSDWASSVRITVPEKKKFYRIEAILGYAISGFEGVLDFHPLKPADQEEKKENEFI